MKSDRFRRLALDLPEAVESSHMGHPDFRVRGRIFATLWPDDGYGVVMLPPEAQPEFIDEHPAVFEQVKGGWGARGATKVLLSQATVALLRPALLAAWMKVAPKRLADEFGGAFEERPARAPKRSGAQPRRPPRQ